MCFWLLVGIKIDENSFRSLVSIKEHFWPEAMPRSLQSTEREHLCNQEVSSDNKISSYQNKCGQETDVTQHSSSVCHIINVFCNTTFLWSSPCVGFRRRRCTVLVLKKVLWISRILELRYVCAAICNLQNESPNLKECRILLSPHTSCLQQVFGTCTPAVSYSDECSAQSAKLFTPQH